MLSCLWDDAYKTTVVLMEKVAHVAAGFLSCYLSSPLLYMSDAI